MVCPLATCLALNILAVFYVASRFATGWPEYTRSANGPAAGNAVRSERGTENCEIIDVVIMVNDQESCNNAVLLIKSILLFRRSPLRLHLLVDSTARHVMETLLRTWHIYGLEYHFYNSTAEQNRENSSYSAIIHLLNTLPIYVERVIYLQSELLLFTDIRKLWRMFSEMEKEGKVLGVCDVPASPKRGERNCSDLVFIEVKELRQRWAQYWNKQTLSFEFSSKTRSLGFISLHNLISIECCEVSEPNEMMGPIYLPHQDHRTYSSVHSSHLLRTLIQEYDGNLLRERWINCQTGPSFDKNAIDYKERVTVYDPPCTDFKREGNQVRRTHPFYAGQWLDPHSSSHNDITLLLHATMDRLIVMLELMCRHWEGPMSIAVFANDSEVSSLLDLIGSSPVISSRRNIAYHIVYKEGVYYPSNVLRLTALQNIGTSHVFMNDIDFLPSFGLYSYLKKAVNKFDLNHTVLVIPAFETHENPDTFVFPKDKSMLIDMEIEKRVFQFHKTDYIRGHAPTDYARWRSAKKSYEIQWQPQYEPYLVASRNITPLDPRFISRHFNKVSHIEELYYQRYSFHVLPDGFLLHLPHELSSDAKSQRTNERHSECYIRRRDEWRAEMAEQYGYKPYLVNVYKIWNRLSSSYETSF